MRPGVVLAGEQGAPTTIVDGRFLGPVISCDTVGGFTVQGLIYTRSKESQKCPRLRSGHVPQ